VPRRVALALALALALSLAGCSSDDEGGPDRAEQTRTPRSPATTARPSDPASEPPDTPRNRVPKVVDTIASGLEAPWGLDFLPDGTAVVTERDSRRVLAVTAAEVTEIGTIDEAAPREEAGLLGVAVSPTYDEDSLLYFYVSTSGDNRIVRARYDGSRLGDTEPILTGIPNGFIHDGGRLEFGPDGFLYASTGETGNTELAQDRGSLGGKILRITTDGEPAPGNPDPGSPVWSWGHRNVQGLAFDESGQLWASEFGSQAFDELNRIEKGGNYGWPVFEGDGGAPDYTDPQVVWRTSEASPSGLAFSDGSLWMASLRGERLWRITVDGPRAVKPTDFFVGDYGRIRTVVVAPDGRLWVTTSNRDGRGDPAGNDDRILVVRP
jgi:glucose/arabinose dehydrogenase